METLDELDYNSNEDGNSKHTLSGLLAKKGMENKLRAGFTNVLLGGDKLLGKPTENQSSIKH